MCKDGETVLLLCHEFQKEFTSDDLIFGRCPYCGAKIDVSQAQAFLAHEKEEDRVLHEDEVVVQMRGTRRSRYGR
jgi:hypothetical protein